MLWETHRVSDCGWAGSGNCAGTVVSARLTVCPLPVCPLIGHSLIKRSLRKSCKEPRPVLERAEAEVRAGRPSEVKAWDLRGGVSIILMPFSALLKGQASPAQAQHTEV